MPLQMNESGGKYCFASFWSRSFNGFPKAAPTTSDANGNVGNCPRWWKALAINLFGMFDVPPIIRWGAAFPKYATTRSAEYKDKSHVEPQLTFKYTYIYIYIYTRLIIMLVRKSYNF